MRRALTAVSLAVLAFVAAPATSAGQGGGTPGTASGFELVGHEPLFARGMNAGLANYGDFFYVGNRTDGSGRHSNPGILVVDAGDPAAPEVVHEIGPPDAAQEGVTTRELRVWPEKELLIVMTFRCSSGIHDCPAGNDATYPFDIDFYDLSDPAEPERIGSYVPRSEAGQPVKPHEMYLWVDPKDEDRALLWLSTPTSSTNQARPNMMVVDISDVPGGGTVRPVAEGNWNHLFPGAEDRANYDFNLAVHSMTPTPDGRRTYLAYLRGSFLAVDTSRIAEGRVPEGEVESLDDDLLTDVEQRPTWGESLRDCPGGTPKGCSEAHSAVPVPGRPFALTTDEVYGTFTDPSFGWPWGWARVLNVANPERPRILAEYKLPQNTTAFQPDSGTQEFTSYASHNPTLTRKVGFVTWHSGGLQAIDLTRAGSPAQAGWFSPQPLGSVTTEDPALSRGPNKVVMWSFPVIKDGLIYVVDIRNGLYVLRYTGPHAKDIDEIDFLEGNSNLGDALRLDASAGSR